MITRTSFALGSITLACTLGGCSGVESVPYTDDIITAQQATRLAHETVSSIHQQVIEPLVEGGSFESVRILPLEPEVLIQGANRIARVLDSEMRKSWNECRGVYTLNTTHQELVLKMLRDDGVKVDPKVPYSYVAPLIELASSEKFQRSETWFQFVAVPRLMQLGDTLRFELTLVHVQSGKERTATNELQHTQLAEATRYRGRSQDF